ncbi:MAG: M20/M25/M40 family metallo-hydrolase [Chloroflexota bacterium]|nr:M20/M25/M40 family metallo-hydrolase [Chloroflexota bacterium]
MTRPLPRFFLLLGIFIALSAAGCTSATPAPIAQPAIVSTLAPTSTSTPSPTSTAEPTAPPTLTATPSPTATLRPTATPTLKAIANGTIARQHLQALSETIGARVAGTPQETQAARYIQTALQKLGYLPQLQSFSVTARVNRAKTTFNSANVIAVKPGLSNSVIIVGAHYDSTDDGKGADDNASGVAVMLETAEKVKNIQTPYTIRFIAFGSEEIDLNGSRYYVDQLSETDKQNTVGMINLDSLIAGDITYVYGDAGSARSIRDWILKTAGASFQLETRPVKDLDAPDGTPCDCADYGPFQAAGIPFAYFEATNWNLGKKDGYTQVNLQLGKRGEIWHTEYDNLGYIESTFPGRIDQHLNQFVALLYDMLTQFKVPR